MKAYHFTTYTFSKACLEHYLAYLHQKDIPRFKLSFVRPSIVSVAQSDPYPGWNTSLDALNGVIGLIATGLFSGMQSESRLCVALCAFGPLIPPPTKAVKDERERQCSAPKATSVAR